MSVTETRPAVDERPRFEGAWERKQIAEIIRNVIDYRGRTPKKLGMEWGGGDIPALSARNVKKGYIDLNEETYFASEKLYQRWMQSGETCPGDLAVTLEAPLGNIALIPDGQKYILSQRVICLQLKEEWCDGEFVFHVLTGDHFQSLLLSNASGSTAQGIQRSRFERLHIPLPPLPEQRAIAAALSDVDDLLQSLDRLIAKKRDVKQGAMQQLLTGTTRLPGFEGAWETKQLGELGKLFKGSGIKKDEVRSEGLPCVRYGEIYTSFENWVAKPRSFITEKTATQATQIQVGDLLFAASGETAEEIGKCVAYLAEGPAFAGGDIVALRPADDCDSLYLGCLLNTPEIARQKSRLGQGHPVAHIGARALGQVVISLPPLPEQRAIAAVLSDMDAEIDALEARRDKTAAIKQGMMQELLIGRTRLPIPQEGN